jgi:hypothetical protein
LFDSIALKALDDDEWKTVEEFLETPCVVECAADEVFHT